MGKDPRRDCGRGNLKVAAILERKMTPKKEVKVELRPAGGILGELPQSHTQGQAWDRAEEGSALYITCPLQE